jgi:hypothetical protein
VLGVVTGRLRTGLLVRRGTEGFEAGQRVGLFVGLEHDVAFEQLVDVRLQFDGRHLQQADGLLQLRRHRQLLTHAQL